MEESASESRSSLCHGVFQNDCGERETNGIESVKIITCVSVCMKSEKYSTYLEISTISMEFDLPQQFLHLWNSEYRGSYHQHFCNSVSICKEQRRLFDSLVVLPQRTWNSICPLLRYSDGLFQTQSIESAGKPWNSICPLSGGCRRATPLGLSKEYS
jgi:hypothetical protein